MAPEDRLPAQRDRYQVRQSDKTMLMPEASLQPSTGSPSPSPGQQILSPNDILSVMDGDRHNHSSSHPLAAASPFSTFSDRSSPLPIPFASTSTSGLFQASSQHYQANHPQDQQYYDSELYDDAAFPIDGAFSFGTPSYAGSFVGSYESASHLSEFSNPSSYNNNDAYPPSTSSERYQFTESDYYHQQQMLQQNLQGSGEFDRYRQQPYLNPADSNSAYPSFLNYRETSQDHDDGASSYAPSEAGDSVAGSTSGHPNPPNAGVGMDFDFDPIIHADSRSTSPFMFNDEQSQQIDDPLQRGNLVGAKNQTTLRAISHRPPNSSRSNTSRTSTTGQEGSPGLVLSSIVLSESPPNSHGVLDLRTSPPALTPLAIPTDGPSFNVIQPTPHTARPKEKGQQTLELERMLGMGEWPTKGEQHASFSEYLPRAIDISLKQPSTSTTKLHNNTLETTGPGMISTSVAPSSSSTISPSNFAPTSLGTEQPSLAYGFRYPTPTRKRSKSDPAVSPGTMFPPGPLPLHDNLSSILPPNAPVGQSLNAAPYGYFFPSSVAGGQGQFLVHPSMFEAGSTPQAAFNWTHSAAPPPLPALDPNDTYGVSMPQTVDFSHHANLSLGSREFEFSDLAHRQHSLESKSRSTVGGRNPLIGTPGYHQAGLLDRAAGSPAPLSHRRARSQTGFPRGLDFESRPSNSTAEAMGLIHGSSSSHEGPPRMIASSRERSASPDGDGLRPQSRSNSGSSKRSGSSPGFLGEARSPYMHQSPAASPSTCANKGRPSSLTAPSKSGSGDASNRRTSGSLSLESKTTAATIEAAMRRRNPGAQAKFVCDLCGETFTRRYNLRGHQRAHRNEKPFACHFPGCGKAFARSHDCKRQRYSCEPCKREFVRLDALQRHHRSEVGQACVEQLKNQGFLFSFEGGEENDL